MTKLFRLLGADGQVYASESRGTLGGNGRDRIYGRLDCPSAVRAVASGSSYQRHRVFFADEAAAIEAGYRPCGACMRERYREWRAGPQPRQDYPWTRRPAARHGATR